MYIGYHISGEVIPVLSHTCAFIRLITGGHKNICHSDIVFCPCYIGFGPAQNIQDD